MEIATILKRIDELLKVPCVVGPTLMMDASHVSQGCVSLFSLVYGAESPQLEQLNTAMNEVAKLTRSHDLRVHLQLSLHKALLRALSVKSNPVSLPAPNHR